MQTVIQPLSIAISLTAIGIVFDNWRLNRQITNTTRNHTSARRCHDPQNNIRR